ncbi:MAG: hypothetical protein KAJ14_16120 [Candidatus Omnitrophica bacterium]|nr:hypothetical protein [Candidatus Omnitrophota bacterium]
MILVYYWGRAYVPCFYNYNGYRKLFKLNLIKIDMENTSNCKIEIERIKQERDSWKETALVAGSPIVMRSIEKSLKQISSGEVIPLAQL